MNGIHLALPNFRPLVTMFSVRIMVCLLFACSIPNSLTQHRNFNYSIQGLAQKLSRTNENKDQNATNQRNNTQFFIERQPWWLHLKNRNDNVQTATGIPTVKEIELFGRKDARRGRSYYASESVSRASDVIICPVQQQLIFGCLPSLYYLLSHWLSNGRLFI